jgi:BirA family biotin operon repressor/biotin-[acetyl-CoA-carboxylase] ligase
MYNAKPIIYLHFDTLTSTNTWVKEHAASLNQDSLTCVTAFEQTHGRGRHGRRWVSPRGQNVYATFYFCVEQNAPYLLNLGQVLSLSCAKILTQRGFPPEIKWPNDLLLGKKKVAGVLCETLSFPDRMGIALGIGINVNMSSSELAPIDQPATSLAESSSTSWDIESLVTSLATEFLKDLTHLQAQGFSSFQKEYEHLLAFRGREVLSEDGIKGSLEGVDARGQLLLRLQDGTLHPLQGSAIRPID